MVITFWKGVFVSDSKPEDWAELKKAGFEKHEPTLCANRDHCKACRARIGRRFWSPRIEDATRVKSHCNEAALKIMQGHLHMLEKSRAVSSNIEVPCPPGLEYLPYQKAGIAYAIQRKDTLIGDQPGLGKTVEALGFVNYIKPKNVLVIAPATLAFNWKMEAEKWLVETRKVFIPKTGTSRIPAEDNLFVITNYEKLVPRMRDGEEISEFTESLKRIWDVIIFDESQALKNPESKRSIAVFGEFGLMRRAHRTLFLSGTPMENYPKEIWPMAAAICPAKFGDWWTFARRYCGLHQERHNGHNTWVATGSSHLSELQQRLRTTFMVRRLKHDVLKELPPKRRQLVVLGDKEIDWSEHPEFRKWKEVYEKKYEAALAKLEAAKTNTEYKAAVRALDAFVGVAFQEMSEFRHKTALAKLPMCLSYIDELLTATSDSIVIFAHHKDVLSQITEHYAEDSVTLYGDTPMEDRGEIIRKFQAGKKRIFIGGLKAAGAGITLTRASTVIFCEIDWNPAVLSQAEDRLCRFGQSKMVHVLHLALNNTLDVNMSQRVIAKQQVIDKALDHLPEQLRLQQVG
jgi:SWI/SNF-related matrix-associated actin-dependent regulator 1 of chromatin subfamily A